MKKLIIELLHLFCGADNRLSIRRVMASAAFVRFLKLECNGASEAYIWALVFLIGAMLGMTTYQNMKMNQSNTPEQ